MPDDVRVWLTWNLAESKTGQKNGIGCKLGGGGGWLRARRRLGHFAVVNWHTIYEH